MTRTNLFQPVAQQDTKEGVVNTPITQMVVTNDDAAKVPLQVQGAAAQADHLTDWKDSTGTVLAYVDLDGDASFEDITANSLDLGGGAITGATLPADSADNTVLANMPANTVKANPTAGSADPQDVAVGTNTVLGRQGSNLVAAQVATGQVADDAVTDAKLRNSGALSVIGRSPNSSGDPADISTAAASDAVLRESGSTIGFGTVATKGIADNAVTDAKLRDSAALSVIGRSPNSSGDPADIAAGTLGHVLRRDATPTIGFGTLLAGAFATGPGIVTPAMLDNGTARSLLGVAGGSAAARADIAFSADGHILQRQSGTVTSTLAPVSLDLSATTNDLGGNSGAKGRKFLIPFEWTGAGSQTPAIGFNIGGQNMDLPQHPMTGAMKLTRLSINIQHNTGASPGNWQITCANATAGTTGSMNASTTNLAFADNVTHGAPDSLITFAAGDRLRIYVNSGGALTDPRIAGFMEFVTNG